jgi:hypothetical protein
MYRPSEISKTFHLSVSAFFLRSVVWAGALKYETVVTTRWKPLLQFAVDVSSYH